MAVQLAPRAVALLPMAVVTLLAGLWAIAPTVPVRVHGAAVFLDPRSRVGVFSRATGQIQSLLLELGDPVSVGTAVVQIDREDQRAPGTAGADAGTLVQQLQANALKQQAVQAQIAAIRTSNQPIGKQVQALETLRQEEVIPRYSPLWVSAQDLFLRNAANIHSLEGQLAQLRVDRSEVEARMASLDVRSPAAGVLLSLDVIAGQSVEPGQRIATVGESTHPTRQRLATALFTEADASTLDVDQPIDLEPQFRSRDQYGGTEQRFGSVRGRIRRISPAPLDLQSLAVEVGGLAQAKGLMVSARHQAYGDGGDPLADAGGKLTAPLMLVEVELESAETPSALSWSRGRGPDTSVEAGTPALARVTLEHRSPVSFVMPFVRWLGGLNR